jgi:RNA polymerase sigma-70 factor (ECF subfamily)
MPLPDPLVSEARARWPSARLDDAAVVAHVTARLGPGVAQLDVLFAALTLSGHAAAQADFDALVRAEVRRAVTPIDASPSFLDEVVQLVLTRLLVGPTPRLAEYSGQGALAAWLRAVAVRLALNARRPGGREEAVSAVPDQPLADPDPELALLRRRYQDQFKRAFEVAVQALTSRERTLLRLTTLDGLTLAQVGPMYGKDASTISRWLATARATLLERTRDALGAELQLSGSQLDSVMRAADSELNVSILRLLQSSSGA